MTWSLEIHHIGVGQGDATLIIARNSQNNLVKSALIDSGLKKAAGIVHQYIAKHLTQLDVMVATDYDSDHCGGLGQLLQMQNTTIYNQTVAFDQGVPDKYQAQKEDFTVYADGVKAKNLNNSGFKRVTERINSFYIIDLDSKRDHIRASQQKDTFGNICDDPDWLVGKEILWSNGNRSSYASNPPNNAPTITCIAANKYVKTSSSNQFCSKVGRYFVEEMINEEEDEEWEYESVATYNWRENEDANGKSLAFLVKFGSFHYYIGGDLETVQESVLQTTIKNQGGTRAMKASHHGSSASTADSFLADLAPTAVFISCGWKNKHKHPTLRVLNSLENCNSIDAYYLSSLPAQSPSSLKQKLSSAWTRHDLNPDSMPNLYQHMVLKVSSQQSTASNKHDAICTVHYVQPGKVTVPINAGGLIVKLSFEKDVDIQQTHKLP